MPRFQYFFAELQMSVINPTATITLGFTQLADDVSRFYSSTALGWFQNCATSEACWLFKYLLLDAREALTAGASGSDCDCESVTLVTIRLCQ